MINKQFNADSSNPVILYLFGDNTCQSDIDRRKFFFGDNTTPHNTLFDAQCNKLIAQLNELAWLFRSRTDNYQYIQNLIKLFTSDKQKALLFRNGNPGLNQMTNDVIGNDNKMVSKGEFIVKGDQDLVRYLQLPNILNLNNSAQNNNKQLLDLDKADECLEALARITKPQSDIRLITATKSIVRQPHTRTSANQSREWLFRAVYEELQRSCPFLGQLDDTTLKTYVEQFRYLADDDEDLNQWTDEELIGSISSVLTEAKLLNGAQRAPMNNFANIYNHAVEQFTDTETNPSKISTYRLFILQSFLYLCALQIRLKNPECARTFLANINSTTSISQIIVDLCTNESALMTRLKNEYGVTAEEYAGLIASCHQIVIHHLEAPHYDELRTACMPSNIKDTQYLVIGGRLCWSTSPITEDGNIKTERIRANRFAARFRTLFTTKPTDSEIQDALSLLLNDTLCGSELVYEEISLASLEAYIDFFSEQECLELLNTALEQKKYTCAHLLLVMGADDKQLFLRYFNEPFNQVAVECFLDANSSYSDYISKDDLVEAYRNGLNDKVSVILKYKPEFSTLGELCYQHESQLKPQFDHLLDFWKNKANSFSRLNHHSASLAATALFEQLTAAGNRFFSCRLSQQSMDTFEKECKSAFDDAKPVMDSHRGWHGLPLFLRAVLGFIAAITIVPAVIVALATPKGYAGTFFKCSETDSAQRLTEMQGDVDRLCRSLT